MATTTRGAPSDTASVPGRNGNGVASWITAPETSEVRYTSGGRMRPRFATSCAALGGPQLCRLMVMVSVLQTDRSTKPPNVHHEPPPRSKATRVPQAEACGGRLHRVVGRQSS